MVTQSLVWRILPLSVPRVLRRCPRCAIQQPFESSGRFRVNAHQRKLDVWLIYRCADCDFTWNRPLLERTPPERIPRDLYQAFLDNDPATAERYAFDRAGLRRLGVTVEVGSEVQVERPPLVLPVPPESVLELRLEVPWPTNLRLDRMLAEELGLSRSRLESLFREGALQSSCGRPEALRRPVTEGQQIRLQVGGLLTVPSAATRPQVSGIGAAPTVAARPGEGERRERPRAVRADSKP